MLKRIFVLVAVFLSIQDSSSAQFYNLEMYGENKSRDEQLLNFRDTFGSQLIRSNFILNSYRSKSKKIQLTILPITLAQQLNTTHAYGWNDGVMRQINGYQMLIRPGVNIRYKSFEFQGAPELLFVGNPSYSQVFSGQSFMKAHLGSITMGLSSENLWWGPGMFSSLLMSNNAPGFTHLFVETNKPIKTKIGQFEFKIIGGRLESKEDFEYENGMVRYGIKNNNWRYLNSYTLSWQPKWINGLYLGLSRSLQQYGEPAFNRPVSLFKKYFPVLSTAIEKKNNLGDDTLNVDQLASFFVRWVLPASQSEFYFEFGKNDYGINVRDYLSSPSHSMAYTLGFRKVLPIEMKKYLSFGFEMTQMTQSPDYLVRDAGNWYVHWQIYQGYTHYNQIIGAGAGFGANVQTLSGTLFNGDNKNTFLIQRVERDPVGKLNKWTDISIGWMPQWKYKNMLIGAKLQLIRSNNYNWEKGNHSFNLHSRLMIQYNFK